MESETFVIVGAMLAGAKTAEALRDEGFDGRVILIGDEAERPYERPPLSKDYLQGKSEKEKIYVHPEGWYVEHDVDLRQGIRVTGIDPSAHQVSIEGGEQIRYEKLLLATGSSPRLLPLPGVERERVFMLRRLEDCEKLKTAFASVSRVAMVGAGWIGLEVAAAARAAGIDVTVLETAELPLLKVLGREAAQVFADLHTRHGVDLRFGVHVSEITGDDPARATGVLLADGARIDADMVVVGVGATPNSQLAEAAGLAVDNGVQVDEHLRTSEPDIYAAGDVANQFNPRVGKHIRVEHWANALNQPAVAAKSMLGVDAVYDTLPYFYSDQYELGMEYSGYVEPDGYDEVVFRGDRDALEFIAFWMKDHKVLAGMNVNVWDETDHIRALIESGQPIDSARLADTGTALTDLLSSVAAA
ncbi:FAD-dependent oxidoreductase [Humibacter ginsengiterrae]